MKNIKKNYNKINRMQKSKNFSLDYATRYKTDINIGLSDEQINERYKNGYVNYSKNVNTKSLANILLTNFFSFFNILCFLIAGLLIAVGSSNNLFFMVIIIANLLIGIVQEIRAKYTIEKISLITTPHARVIRNSLEKEIHIKDIVLDDIIKYALGNQICADSVVLDGEVEVNESLLTGESEPVKKCVGDVLYSGSFIVSGNCVAKVDKIGKFNYSENLAQKAKRYKRADSELLKSLKTIIKVIGIAIIPLGIFSFYKSYSITGNALNIAITKTAGNIIGMIPAGMFLLTSMALAVGVIRLAKKRTLVQDLYGIETLSRINVLCLDKTGTLTDGTMIVKEIVNYIDENKIKDIISNFNYHLTSNNGTSKALLDYFGSNSTFTPQSKLNFNSERKHSAMVVDNQTFALGAPEFVVENISAQIKEDINKYTKNGSRVIMLASSNSVMKNEKLPKDMSPIALVVIEDHIREDAISTIKWFKENDVEIKIISGDNAITVSEISRKVGVENADKYISLEGLSDQEVINCALKYNIFGRVSPEQKALLVKSLKASNKKVAMTGDGVNDILALKESDCSIAMASGSEATRNVSHLVLLDSNFSSMPSVVTEGRRVINNITKSSSLFLMKTFFTICLTLLTFMLPIAYPLIPNQILLLEVFTIGLPSFFLALQTNKDRIKGNFLTNVLKKSLFGGIIFVLIFIACYIFDIIVGSGLSYETMTSITVSFAGLALLLKLCLPLNWYRATLVSLTSIFCVLAVLIIPQEFFSYVSLNLQSKMFMTIILLVVLIICIVFYKIEKHKKIEKHNKK